MPGAKVAAKPKLSPEEEAQREDEQVLAQTERDIEEIMGLIGDKTDRAEAERRLAEAEGWVEEKKEGTIFHQHTNGNRKIPLKHHTSNLFKLTDALKLSMQTKRHGADLHRALDNHLRHMVKVQRRIMKRGLF
jgi:hypothetical protein